VVFDGAAAVHGMRLDHDEDIGGIPFEKQPDEYMCSACGVPKSFFEKL
jgi:rubredoxin